MILWAADTWSHRSAILTPGKVVQPDLVKSVEPGVTFVCLAASRNALSSFLTYRATNVSTRVVQMSYFLRYGIRWSRVTYVYVRLNPVPVCTGSSRRNLMPAPRRAHSYA